MEVPPPPLSAVATAAVPPSNYPDSISSSPGSRHTDSCDADTPNPSTLPKLRLMCSYGGHIIPRPHDKSLCYVGGDTRIIVIDRQSSLSDLHNRLSITLLQSQPFSLKYQLPNEDLDSLISLTTEEDLENMVDEYDRLNRAAGGLKPGRLRLFLFPKSLSMEQVLAETASIKSEDRFLNAVNGVKEKTLSAAGSSRHVLSESSSVNCLLGLDDGSVGKSVVKGVESQLGSAEAKNGNANHDVNSVPDSPMLENSSSFGSTSSSHSMANLPPIRVRVSENPKVGQLGIDEHFHQMNLGPIGVGGNLYLPRPKPEVGAFAAEGVVPDAVVAVLPAVGEDYANLVVSDDERSDNGGYKKVLEVRQQAQFQPLQIPPFQPPHIPQFQQKQASANDLASPDSISSEGSATNPLSRQRQPVYQESGVHVQSVNNRVNANPVDMKVFDPNNGMVQLPVQVQEPAPVLPSQFDQSPQQFVHAGVQYIPAGAMPVTSYYPLYPPQQQHRPHQSMLHQQYPVYLVPARQAQPYNIPVQQQNYSEMMPNAPSSRPQLPPAAIAPIVSYNQARNAAPLPEMASGMYRTAGAARQLVQVPSNQHQAQLVGFSQIHHPSQSVAPTSAANSAYAYEFDPVNAQMYSTQPLPPQLAAQYQAITSASAAVLPEVSTQLPTESVKNQVGISQI